MKMCAIDWSGKIDEARKSIWLAEVTSDGLVRLESGRDRHEIIDHVIGMGRQNSQLCVGLDFAFSLPAWYLKERKFGTVNALWDWLGSGGAEDVLQRCDPPFWGKAGKKKPTLEAHFRVTEEEPAIAGISAKSVFQIAGAGAVGTGSLRGMAFLATLAKAGWSIWPFDDVKGPTAIEIYPRRLTGKVVKSNSSSCEGYLRKHFRGLSEKMIATAASCEDAFDAAVSALVMWEHRHAITALKASRDSRVSLEGWIWDTGRACPA